METRSIGLHTYLVGKSNFFFDVLTINYMCFLINFPSLVDVCKVMIYNYVLCWLYSTTKSVVIALIYFLVFCGILLYWV